MEIVGQLERITYVNEENGYTIAKLTVKGQRDLLTIAGYLQSVVVGEVMKIQGQWFNHPKYGEQLKVDSFISMVPATVAGIQKYLGSGLIKGIGPVMAKRIVSKFGTDTINVIENLAERLSEIEGIGRKRVEMIKKAWHEQRDIKEVMLFLQGHGVSAVYATKIFRHYGKEAISIVKNNPYRLAHDIFGIGFVTADKIAGQMGIDRNSIIRAEAGIIYTLHQLSGKGHLYYPFELLIEECKKILLVLKEDNRMEVDREVLLKAFGNIALEKMIVIEDLNEDEIEVNNKAVYLTKYHVSEVGVANNLKKLLKAPKLLRTFDMGKALAWVQNALGIKLAENQVKAVEGALVNKVLVITGGPGTGKTTIIKSIIKIYGKLGQRILLAAPTGRAAKKMSEATGHEAKTIHRLLGFSPGEGGFQ
ncbi:MAG: AAA family ATPase, partial [Nitrospirae bacterium]|nr:AAA family ATPase [Nitrospirota bacterium]